jgi:flagellar biosynthesis/type III secretory pathway protein FliH
LSRVLRQAGVADRPRIVGSPSEAPRDPELVALLRDAAAQGYERGREAGLREGRAAGASQVPAAVAAAFEEGVRALSRWQQASASDVVGLALAIAGRVLEREPSEESGLLAGRIEKALAALDDSPLVISVHPADLELTAAAVASREGVSALPDASLRPGEARITGPWSRAELTREAALAAVAEALREIEPGTAGA